MTIPLPPISALQRVDIQRIQPALTGVVAMPGDAVPQRIGARGVSFLSDRDDRLSARPSRDRALPMRSKFDAEKFVLEAEAELKRLKDARQARRDAALKEIREKNWPRWLKYLVIGALRAAMLRNEYRHATFEPASAAWRAARKARDN